VKGKKLSYFRGLKGGCEIFRREGVNWPDVRNVPIQTDALNLFIANQSLDAIEEIVGSGQRAHNPEGAIQREQARKEKEKDTRTKFNILMAQIRDRITELENQWAELKAEMVQLRVRETTLESSLGGLDKMGQDLGASRLPDEDDEAYRTRLKLIIDRKITAGEIDPASMLAQWSTNHDDILHNKKQQTIVTGKIQTLEQAIQTRDPQIMEQALELSSKEEFGQSYLDLMSDNNDRNEESHIQSSFKVAHDQQPMTQSDELETVELHLSKTDANNLSI